MTDKQVLLWTTQSDCLFIGLTVTTVSSNTLQVDGISIGGSRITLPNEVLQFPVSGIYQYLNKCVVEN